MGYRKFVNRRSAAHKAPTAGGNTLTHYHRAKDLEFESARANLLFDAALGYAPAVGANVDIIRTWRREPQNTPSIKGYLVRPITLS